MLQNNPDLFKQCYVIPAEFSRVPSLTCPKVGNDGSSFIVIFDISKMFWQSFRLEVYFTNTFIDNCELLCRRPMLGKLLRCNPISYENEFCYSKEYLHSIQASTSLDVITIIFPYEIKYILDYVNTSIYSSPHLFSYQDQTCKINGYSKYLIV